MEITLLLVYLASLLLSIVISDCFWVQKPYCGNLFFALVNCRSGNLCREFVQGLCYSGFLWDYSGALFREFVRLKRYITIFTLVRSLVFIIGIFFSYCDCHFLSSVLVCNLDLLFCYKAFCFPFYVKDISHI